MAKNNSLVLEFFLHIINLVSTYLGIRSCFFMHLRERVANIQHEILEAHYFRRSNYKIIIFTKSQKPEILLKINPTKLQTNLLAVSTYLPIHFNISIRVT